MISRDTRPHDTQGPHNKRPLTATNFQHRSNAIVIFFLSTLTAYSILAPVYWLPGVTFSVISSLKLGLFACAIASAILIASSSKIRVPLGLWGIGLFPLVLLSAITGLTQTDPAGVSRTVFDIGLVTAALLCGIIAGQLPVSLTKYFRFYIVATAAIAILAILVAPTRISITSASLSEGVVGFATGRTGWSNGLALPAVLAASLALLPRQPRNIRLLYLICFSCIFASQISVAGRAGILAVVLTLVICAGPLKLFGGFKAQSGLGLAVTLFVAVIYFNYGSISDYLRFEGYQRGDRSYIDNLSSGRISTYQIAWRLITERFFLGYGFTHWEQTGLWERNFVHNVWLKYLYQSGIIYFISLFVLKTGILLRSIKWDKIQNDAREVAFSPVIIAGLIITMLEPSMLIGSFQKSAVWWFIGGIAIGRLIIRRMTNA